MKQVKTYKLIILSMITALSVVLGYFLKIPTPTGMVTLLDAGIIFAAMTFGRREGAVVGALSGFLIDLIAGYPQWMLFSLLIHGLQGYCAGWKGQARIPGLLLSILVMAGGYLLAGGLLNGWGAALAEVVGNLGQASVGLVVGSVLYQAGRRLNWGVK